MLDPNQLASMSNDDLHRLANDLAPMPIGTRERLRNGDRWIDRDYWIKHITEAYKAFGECQKVPALSLKVGDIGLFTIIEVCKDVENKDLYSVADIIGSTQAHHVFCEIILIQKIPMRAESPFKQLSPFCVEGTAIATEEVETIIKPLQQVTIRDSGGNEDWFYELVDAFANPIANYLTTTSKVLKRIPQNQTGQG